MYNIIFTTVDIFPAFDKNRYSVSYINKCVQNFQRTDVYKLIRSKREKIRKDNRLIFFTVSVVILKKIAHCDGNKLKNTFIKKNL